MAIKFKGKFGPVTGAMRAGDFVAIGDPYWANVETLLHLDNSYTDEASAATWTIDNGSPVFTTGGSPIGGHGLDLSSGGSIIEVDNDLWDIGLGGESFTIEYYYYKFTNWTPGGNMMVIMKAGNVAWDATNGISWLLGNNNSTGTSKFRYFTGGTSNINIDGNIAMPLNAWTHVAVVNNSSANTFKTFINGVVDVSTTAITITKPTTSNNCTIGNNINYSAPSYQMLDEIRVTKGVARYTGTSFTVPTSPFLPASTPPSIVSDSLERNLDSGDVASYSGSGTTWYDLSGNNADGILVNTTYSGDDGGSMIFNGSSSKVNLGNFGPMWNAGTISFWMNPSIVSNYRNAFHTNYTGSANNVGFRFELNNSGTFGAYIGNDASSYSAHTLISGATTNTWYNVVLTWNVSGNLVNGYVNGVQTVIDAAHTLWATQLAAVTIGVGYSSDSVRWFAGDINRVAMYSKELSQAEVTQNFDVFKGRFGL